MPSFTLRPDPRAGVRSLCATAPIAWLYKRRACLPCCKLSGKMSASPGTLSCRLKPRRRFLNLASESLEPWCRSCMRELKAAHISGRKTVDYRIALMSVIEGMGPAAEGAVHGPHRNCPGRKRAERLCSPQGSNGTDSHRNALSSANRQSIRPKKRGAVVAEGIPQGSCRSRCSALHTSCAVSSAVRI